MADTAYHIPVLVNEVIEYLALKPHGIYVDTTFGGGGHTRAILKAEPTVRVIAFDIDKHAVELNAPSVEQEFQERVKVIWGDYTQITQHLKKEKISSIQGILADFGTSTYQIMEQPGFSFMI